MKDISLAVFSYSFPHKKTIDFLNLIHAKNFKKVSVIAAPKVFLGHAGVDYNGPSTKDICDEYGYRFIEVQHNDKNTIEKFLMEGGSIETAIISGARILRPEIINIFRDGVINFHPGEIPATSGLDSFYWMIENNSIPGTTAHYIDHKVDAGYLISFTPSDYDIDDDESSLRAKVYNSQLASLEDVLIKLKSGVRIERSPIFRPQKNERMTSEKKELVMGKFEFWKKITTTCKTVSIIPKK